MIIKIDKKTLIKFDNYREKMNEWAKEELVADDNWGVGGSTFRAFRGHYKPSKTYRLWARDTSDKLNDMPFNNENFSDLHQTWVNSLEEKLPDTPIRPRAFHLPYKLVDLFTLHIAKRPDISKELRTLLMAKGNVPIDKFSLRALSQFFPGLIMSPKPSMGHVKTRDQYEAMQYAVREITAAAGVPNLYFDCWAWKRVH